MAEPTETVQCLGKEREKGKEKPESAATAQDGCLEQGWSREQHQVTLLVLCSTQNSGEVVPGVLTVSPQVLSSAAAGHPSSWHCAASG